MNKVKQAFTTGSHDSKEGPYSFLTNSLLFGRQINSVPMTTEDEEKKSSLQYGERGYKHFHPWFLSNLNPSSVDREEYWFFRADINILMMWYRVSFLFSSVVYVR